MMIMPIIVLLLLGSISSNVHAEITETPSSGLFLEGSDVTLTCVVEGNDNVVWEDFSDATEIFIGKDKNTEKKKYENFEISPVDGDFSLIIKDVQISDEGTYECKDKDRLAKVTVTIGVLPILQLYVKESEDTQDSQTSTEVNITCSAYNARPAVSVFELSFIGSDKTVNATSDMSYQNEDGNSYNSSATVPFIVSSSNISVHCRVHTAGQSLNQTENFNLPMCNITISGNEVRCTCQANPPVHKYRMELNGNSQDGDVLYIEESNLANVTCFGTNGMGTGRSSILFPGDKAGFGIFSIVVMISVGVVLMVLAVIYIKRRLNSRRGKSDEEQPDENEKIELLPQSGAISNDTELSKDTKGNPDECNVTENSPVSDSSSGTIKQTCDVKVPQEFIREILLQVKKDWEIFAIEILDISEKVVEEAVKTKDKFEEQITAVTANMTAYHIELIKNMLNNKKSKEANLCKQFDIEFVKDEGEISLRSNSRTYDPGPETKTTNKQATGTDEANDQATVTEATYNHAATKTDATNNLAPRTDASNNQAPITDPTNNQAPLTDATNNQAPRKDATNNIAPRTDATNNQAPRTDAANSLAPRTDASNNLAPRTDATNNQAPRKDATNNIAPRTDATNNQAPRTDAANSLAPRTDASNNLAPRTDATNNQATAKTDATDNQLTVTDATHNQGCTNDATRDDLLVSCGKTIGKVGISRLLEAFKLKIDTDDGAALLGTLEKTKLIKKPYIDLLGKLSECRLYVARKIILYHLETDVQQLQDLIRYRVKNDWEIFVTEILGISEDTVANAIHNSDNYKDQIEEIIGEITAKHVQIMSGIYNKENHEKPNILSEFNLECDEEEGRLNFRNLDSKQSYTSNEESINQDSPIIESRDEMIALCRESIGNVGIRRLLAAFKQSNIETEKEANVLKKLDKIGVISKDCNNLLRKLSHCKLYRARKIVLAHSERDLLRHITKLHSKISVDWEIFAVDVLKLDKLDVIEIIENNKDDNGRVLSIFRKWRSTFGQTDEDLSLILHKLVTGNECADIILSEQNRKRNCSALAAKRGDTDTCSEDLISMLSICNSMIGVAGTKRLAEISTEQRSYWQKWMFNRQSETPEWQSITYNIVSLGRLSSILYKANLFSARDVVIQNIEKVLQNEISTISKNRASNWDKLAKYGLSLSDKDVACLETKIKSNEGWCGFLEDLLVVESKKCPPQIEELKPFEDDLLRKIETTTTTTSVNQINAEAKAIAEKLEIDNRMESMATKQAFITLKDHKVNFENNLPCRLINPAKSETGLISKVILDRINNAVRTATKVNQWRNTSSVIEWFKNIQNKEKHTFISFDIVEFYPSIRRSLLEKSHSYG
ncbi:uncharacterized protein [Apostichopus japonicus]|uniref:uncharacterized protein n=1 Tax=Stichopus japonicus TaxID=307972 RepID=UPI003AB6E68B